ncbi:MAG: hypothetical protein FJW88_08140 [Actinobacteria bacterium]|nr:hypothetical protein [Actinomycetota bacterium]
MRRLLRRGMAFGLLAGAAYAAWRFLAARAPDTGGLTFEPQPFPALPRPVPGVPEHHVEIPPAVELEGEPELDGESGGIARWVEATDGACPASHPVKAKLGSGIFHVPGGGSYDRTRADRCYLDGTAAEADGLRPAKR